MPLMPGRPFILGVCAPANISGVKAKLTLINAMRPFGVLKYLGADVSPSWLRVVSKLKNLPSASFIKGDNSSNPG